MCILTPGHFVGNSDSYYTHSWVSRLHIGVFDRLLSPDGCCPQKRTGPQPDDRDGKIMINIHLEVQGTQKGVRQETAGQIIHCDVGSVLSCWFFLPPWIERSAPSSVAYFFSSKSLGVEKNGCVSLPWCLMDGNSSLVSLPIKVKQHVSDPEFGWLKAQFHTVNIVTGSHCSKPFFFLFFFDWNTLVRPLAPLSISAANIHFWNKEQSGRCMTEMKRIYTLAAIKIDATQ